MARTITEENALLDAALANPELAPFAMFEMDAGKMMHEGEPMFPELDGHHTPLWKLEWVKDETPADGVPTETQEDRVARHAAMVANDERLFTDTDDEDDTPEDEWEAFFCGSPTKRLDQIRDDETPWM